MSASEREAAAAWGCCRLRGERALLGKRGEAGGERGEEGGPGPCCSEGLFRALRKGAPQGWHQLGLGTATWRRGWGSWGCGALLIPHPLPALAFAPAAAPGASCGASAAQKCPAPPWWGWRSGWAGTGSSWASLGQTRSRSAAQRGRSALAESTAAENHP
eukprot:1158503-Pelagomonas_calceolata.AAC.7